MPFAQNGIGVEIYSPLGIFILVIGVAVTVDLPIAIIKFVKRFGIQ
tara:strand:+ start:1908 stop:2045 length:138 start_codon:yes stop_codon:yes gene_type:complete